MSGEASATASSNGVTLLTGASSGIGWALALEMACRGRAMALAARRLDRLEALADQIRSAGGRALPIACDVADFASVRAAVARCQAELGPIDCLVANAGQGSPTPASHFQADTVREIFATNVLGVAALLEAVLPEMIARRQGHIVGISSIAAWQGVPTSGAYSASKAALSNLLDALRVELMPCGVTVTTVCPGFVATPMTAENDAPMPFLWQPDRAARVIADAIDARRARLAFPWQLVLLARAGQWLPGALRDWILARALLK